MEINDNIKVKKNINISDQKYNQKYNQKNNEKNKEKLKLIKRKNILKLSKKIYRMKINLSKLRHWRKKKASRYYNNFENFITDFKDIINSDVCTLLNINKLCAYISGSNLFSNITEKIINEKVIIWKEENKILLDELKKTMNDVDYEDQLYDMEEKFRLETLTYIGEIILQILKLIQNKFKKLTDIIIYQFFTIYYKYDVENIVKYLEEINFKTKNQKLINILYNRIDVDIYNLIINPNLSNIFNSAFMFNTDFKYITTFINKHSLEDNKEEYFNILIDLLLNNEFLSSDNTLIKYQNILNYILYNKESLSSYQKIKLYGFSSIVIFCEEYYNRYNFNNVSLIDFLKKIINNIKNIYNNFDLSLTEKIDINIIFQVDDIINTKLLNILCIDASKNIVDTNHYNIFSMDIDGIQLKNFIREFRLCFIDIIKNNIKKNNNIEKFYNLNIFKYDNFILSYDEKTELFDKSYIGKVTNKDIEIFILHNNQIANHIIKNHIPTENMAKIAFNCGNINFIEYLINKKYIITTKHLTFILFNDKELLQNIFNIINHYNLINYFDNFDWYYHLSYIYPYVNFPELIFNENKIEYRNKLNEKILELNINNLVKKINEMSYNDFIKYIRFSSDKIKLDIKDIIKIDDYNKRWFLTN